LKTLKKRLSTLEREKVPDAQDWQGCALMLEYSPARQSLQNDAPTSETEPNEQIEQVDDPEEEEK
jgi:hypothetical protein